MAALFLHLIPVGVHPCSQGDCCGPSGGGFNHTPRAPTHTHTDTHTHKANQRASHLRFCRLLLPFRPYYFHYLFQSCLQSCISLQKYFSSFAEPPTQTSGGKKCESLKHHLPSLMTFKASSKNPHTLSDLRKRLLRYGF